MSHFTLTYPQQILKNFSIKFIAQTYIAETSLQISFIMLSSTLISTAMSWWLPTKSLQILFKIKQPAFITKHSRSIFVLLIVKNSPFGILNSKDAFNNFWILECHSLKLFHSAKFVVEMEASDFSEMDVFRHPSRSKRVVPGIMSGVGRLKFPFQLIYLELNNKTSPLPTLLPSSLYFRWYNFLFSSAVLTKNNLYSCNTSCDI